MDTLPHIIAAAVALRPDLAEQIQRTEASFADAFDAAEDLAGAAEQDAEAAAAEAAQAARDAEDAAAAAMIDAAAAAVAAALPGIDWGRSAGHHGMRCSRYARYRDVTVRVSDHAQPPGGGCHMASGVRYGDSDVCIAAWDAACIPGRADIRRAVAAVLRRRRAKLHLQKGSIHES